MRARPNPLQISLDFGEGFDACVEPAAVPAKGAKAAKVGRASRSRNDSVPQLKPLALMTAVLAQAGELGRRAVAAAAEAAVQAEPVSGEPASITTADPVAELPPVAPVQPLAELDDDAVIRAFADLLARRALAAGAGQLQDPKDPNRAARRLGENIQAEFKDYDETLVKVGTLLAEAHPEPKPEPEPEPEPVPTRRYTVQELLDAVKLHRPYLRGIAYRVLRDSEECEDALQEAMRKAWQAFERFEGRSSLKTWLSHITFSAALTLYQKRKKRQEHVGLARDPDSGVTDGDAWGQDETDSAAGAGGRGSDSTDPSMMAEMFQTKQWLHDALTQLEQADPEAYDTYILAKVHQHKYSEIATQLDRPDKAVRAAMKRAVDHMAAATRVRTVGGSDFLSRSPAAVETGVAALNALEGPARRMAWESGLRHLRAVAPEYWSAVLKAHAHKYTLQELADALDISVPAARQRMTRGYEIMNDFLKRPHAKAA